MKARIEFTGSLEYEVNLDEYESDDAKEYIEDIERSEAFSTILELRDKISFDEILSLEIIVEEDKTTE